jgi:FKBP-type peptidyl-prolyl cis-trans isomerase
MKFYLSLGLLFATIFWMSSCKSKSDALPSGYEYVVITEGTGETPKDSTYVFFTIKIMGDSAKVLQEMKEGPQMPVLQIPKEMPKNPANPVLELLATSKVGGVYQLIMPIDSIPNPPADIKHMKQIIYEIGVKKFRDEEEYNKYVQEMQAEMQAKITASMEKIPAIEELVKTTINDYKSGKLETTNLPSGLKYYIVKKGEGPNATNGSTVSVNYYGTLADGTMFDNSFQRGQSFQLNLGAGQVIKGWDEGLAQLNKGAKAFLFIPAALGYGEVGSPPVIPANSELIFYVELEDIEAGK